MLDEHGRAVVGASVGVAADDRALVSAITRDGGDFELAVTVRTGRDVWLRASAPGHAGACVLLPIFVASPDRRVVLARETSLCCIVRGQPPGLAGEIRVRRHPDGTPSLRFDVPPDVHSLTLTGLAEGDRFDLEAEFAGRPVTTLRDARMIDHGPARPLIVDIGAPTSETLEIAPPLEIGEEPWRVWIGALHADGVPFCTELDAVEDGRLYRRPPDTGGPAVLVASRGTERFVSQTFLVGSPIRRGAFRHVEILVSDEGGAPLPGVRVAVAPDLRATRAAELLRQVLDAHATPIGPDAAASGLSIACSGVCVVTASTASGASASTAIHPAARSAQLVIERPATVRGRVSVGGRGRPDVVVRIVDVTPARHRRGSRPPAPVRECATDDAGRFELTWPGGRSALITATDAEYVPVSVAVGEQELQHDVEVPLVDRGQDVRGTVVGVDGTAIVGASISALVPTRGGAGLRTAISGEGGAFRLSGVPAGGATRIHVTAAGRSSASVAIRDGSEDLRIALAPASVARARSVSLPRADGVELWRVDVSGPDGFRVRACGVPGTSLEALDVPDGDLVATFGAPGVLPFPLKLTARATDAGFADEQVELTDVVVNVAPLEGAADAFVRVASRDASHAGTDALGARPVLYAPLSGGRATFRARAGGEVEIAVLSAGATLVKKVVRISAPPMAAVSLEVAR